MAVLTFISSPGLEPPCSYHSNPFLESSSSSLTPDLDSSGHIENILPDSFCGPGPYSNSSSSSLFQAEPPAVAGAFRGFSASSAPQPPANARGLHVDFDSVFGNKTNGNTMEPAGDRPPTASPPPPPPPP
ncbi:hypothetical protein CRUP_009458 [Coryphaenoides rupestris]|nr:hypothetical protein CRUP_009458 [Coryphaenoides rupestris]